MHYRIESGHKLESDWMPKDVFRDTYTDLSYAIATAIEGVDDPAEDEVRVVCEETGAVVWRSTDEQYED